MHKQDFLSSLEERLKTLPQLEKERILNYYNETLEDAIEDGLSESEAVASLDNLDSIVKGILEEHESELPNENKVREVMDKKRTWRFLLVALSSLFWITGIFLLITFYFIYIVLLASLGIINIMFALFVITGILNLAHIIMLNLASGVLLLGCVLLAAGVLPWLFKLLWKGIEVAKSFYVKGIETVRQHWRKVVV